LPPPTPHPQQCPGGQEGRQRQADQIGVVAEQPGPEVGLIDVQPLRGQGCHKHADEAGDGDLRHAGGVRAPADRDEEQQAAEGVVLEHHLPDAAQVDVHEAQDRRRSTQAFPPCQQCFHCRPLEDANPSLMMSRRLAAGQRQK
jgi:hypothetical protein